MKFPLQALCHWAGAVLHKETGEMLEYRQLIKRPKHRKIWFRGMSHEVGRLAQGIPGAVEGTDTIVFIGKTAVPQDRKKDVTYARIVSDIREGK